MNWEFFVEPTLLVDQNIRWRPTGVTIYKKLLDDTGTELARTRVALPEAMTETAGSGFAEEYLAVVKTHFDSQYDTIYSTESYLHPSMALTFGQELAMCLNVYIALKTGVSDEV